MVFEIKMSKKYPGQLRKASEPPENIDWSQLKSGVWEDRWWIALKGDFSKQTEILKQLKEISTKLNKSNSNIYS